MSQSTQTPSGSSPPTFSGIYLVVCKWFKDSFGYGFVTIKKVGDFDEIVPEGAVPEYDHDAPVRPVGTDIFVYHTDIVPAVSTYKTLVKGEYVRCRLSKGAKDVQAVDVRGIFGGPLLCDSINVRSLNKTVDGRGPAVLQNGDIVYQPGEDATIQLPDTMAPLPDVDSREFKEDAARIAEYLGNTEDINDFLGMAFVPFSLVCQPSKLHDVIDLYLCDGKADREQVTFRSTGRDQARKHTLGTEIMAIALRTVICKEFDDTMEVTAQAMSDYLTRIGLMCDRNVVFERMLSVIASLVDTPAVSGCSKPLPATSISTGSEKDQSGSEKDHSNKRASDTVDEDKDAKRIRTS